MTDITNIDEKVVNAKELFDQGWKFVDTNQPEEAVRCLREAIPDVLIFLGLLMQILETSRWRLIAIWMG